MRVLYLSRWWSHHDRRFAAAWTDHGVDTLALAADGTAPGDGPLGSLDFADRIEAAIADYAPDVIQAGPLTDVAALACDRWDGPLMAMSWGFDLMSEIEDDLPREVARRVIERANTVLVDNDATRARALELGADDANIAQFPWGVDLAWFTPGDSSLRARDAIPAGARLVLCTRANEPIYGVRVLVDAFLAVATSRPSLYLALAGGGSEAADYRDVAEAAGLGDRLVLLGQLEAKDLRDAYRAADLYVSPSFVDGTSISLLEAMACGAPACVSAIPGNREWIDESTGISFQPGSVDELAGILTEFVDHPAEFDARATRRAEAALRRVRERADWSKTAASLPALAERTIALWSSGVQQ